MTWLFITVAYLLIGLMVSHISNVGCKLVTEAPLSWHGWVAITIGWLPATAIVCFGRRKK